MLSSCDKHVYHVDERTTIFAMDAHSNEDGNHFHIMSRRCGTERKRADMTCKHEAMMPNCMPVRRKRKRLVAMDVVS